MGEEDQRELPNHGHQPPAGRLVVAFAERLADRQRAVLGSPERGAELDEVAAAGVG